MAQANGAQSERDQSEAAPTAPQWVVQADTRLRYEFVDADDRADSGAALTLLIRPSVEFSPAPQISLLAEIEGIVSLLPDRQNGFLGAPGRPEIADAETLELNRLQLEWAPDDRFSIAIGRQGISIDDERFIGTVDFRQNQQTYDAVTASLSGPGALELRGGYIWRVGRALGPDQANGVFDSDSFFLTATLPLSFGQVSAFHFDLDLDDRVAAPLRSHTTGVALRGRAFRAGFGLFWEAAYARQASAGAAPEYLRAAITAERGDVALDFRFEQLGSEAGTAFQTPLATLHRFQGAADLFLVTPPQGIADFQARASWRIGSLGPTRGTELTVQYNDFSSAVDGVHYGHEWGAEFATTIASTRLSLLAAHYSADQFAADTTRIWLTVARKF